MDGLEKVNREVSATLGLLDEPCRITSSPDFAVNVIDAANRMCQQSQGAMKYKIYALAAVLLVAVFNVYAIAKTVSQTRSIESDANMAMVENFEQSRLGVFWPIE